MLQASKIDLYLSFMPVVDIGSVRVIVVQGFMHMGLRMISHKRSVMGMPVVFLGVMVEMLVRDREMVVPVRMSLGREHQGPGKHQSKCNQHVQVRIFAEQEKRECRTDEWCDTEVCAGPCSTKIPQCPDKQDHAEAITEKPEKQCGKDQGDCGKGAETPHFPQKIPSAQQWRADLFRRFSG
jgi:hypothetical protein